MSAAAARKMPARRVLVVEDESAMCDLISDIVEDAGLEAVCVSSDRDAYAMLSGQARYEALVVDVNLGTGTTGFDVARFARQITEDLPVIYVSGQAAMSSFKAFGVPRSEFLPKPFEPAELVQKLRELTGLL